MLLWIVAINVAVVGAETWVLARQLGQNTRQETIDLAEELVFTLRDKLRADPAVHQAELLAAYEERWTVRDESERAHLRDMAALAVARFAPGPGLNVGPLLSWPSWQRFSDAMLLDRNLVRDDAGRLMPRGVALNPVGRARRHPGLDEQAVFEAVVEAVASGRPVEVVQGGTVVPIAGPDGVFGACWYVLPPPTGGARLFLRYVLPAFVFSTVLLSAGTFFALRRFVLDPVDRLAQGASRVAEGDLSTRVPETGGEDELSALIANFNRMTARVSGFQEELAAEVARATAAARQAEAAAMTQRRLAAMGELAAGIAHEINNPLGGLLNAVEALGREDLPAPRRARYLELLSVGLERIGRTVGQLLRFTPRSTAAAPLRVHLPVLDAVALVRHRARSLGVELLVGDGLRFEDGAELSPELTRSLERLPRVRGEAHEIAQALLNLLVNALDALEERAGGPAGGHVRVSLCAVEGGLVIEVADDGPGVPAEVLERAADLFYTTKAPGKGSGLGLSIVHNVVAAHGGRVRLESRPGQGFRVRIELPGLGEPA
jgi:signal transduction histidine kinase